MAGPAARLRRRCGTSASSHRAHDVFQSRGERVAGVAEKSGTIVPRRACAAWPHVPSPLVGEGDRSGSIKKTG